MMKRHVSLFLLFIILSVLVWNSLVDAVEEGSANVVLKTSSAEYDEKTGMIYAKDQSTIQWKGVTMICPYLEVDTLKQEAKSDGEIQVHWEDKTIFSKTLNFYGKDNKVIMTDISGKGKDFSFQTQKMDFLFSPGKIILTGNPVLFVKDFEIHSQQIEYHIDQKRWLASSVNISKEGWIGQSQTGYYQEGSENITLEGNASVEKDENLLRGERILIDTLTGNVKVEGNVEINIMAAEGEEGN